MNTKQEEQIPVSPALADRSEGWVCLRVEQKGPKRTKQYKTKTKNDNTGPKRTRKDQKGPKRTNIDHK